MIKNKIVRKVVLLTGLIIVKPCFVTADEANVSPSSSTNVPAATDAKTGGSGADSQYPNDENRYDGDRLRMRVNADIFIPVSSENKDKKCAPKGSVMSVKSDYGDTLSLRFLTVPVKSSLLIDKSAIDSANIECPTDKRVNESTQYTVTKNELERYDFARSGVTYGGLIVPFKFYLGDDKRIAASSTIAPYIGFRNPDFFGITLTPLISAGLGLVPVNNPTNNTTETKAAFSTAVGFVLSSSKNESFNAGVVFGKDFLSQSDRELDPSVNDAWFSLYVGYSL